MRKLFFNVLVVAFAITIAVFIWHRTQQKNKTNQSDSFTITFLDIGQGDATYLAFPSGQDMLVDCAIDARILEALGRVLSFKDKTIDYLIITHPDRDHYGGCIDVLKRYTVKHIVQNGFEKLVDPYWQELRNAIQAEGAEVVTIEKEQTWDIGGVGAHFLYPDHSIQENSALPGEDNNKTESNNTSIVFELSYSGVEVLLTADAEEPLEAYLVKTYKETLDTDILKAGHHGSAGSTSQPFLDLVTPTDVVFSAGKGNSYGHPSGRVLKRVERAKAAIWRTDAQGDITLVIFKTGEITRQIQKNVREY